MIIGGAIVHKDVGAASMRKASTLTSLSKVIPPKVSEIKMSLAIFNSLKIIVPPLTSSVLRAFH